MKLVSIVPAVTIPVPGIRAHSGSVITPGEGAFRDWSLHVRGPSVFLCSPPGWEPGKAAKGDERAVFEIPRAQCQCIWEMQPGDQIEDVAKHSPIAKCKCGTLLAGTPLAVRCTKCETKLEEKVAAKMSANDSPDPSKAAAVEDADPATASHPPQSADRAASPKGAQKR